jgi:FMN-dependent NADH-azoreductase
MTKLLYIIGSPRSEASYSSAIGDAFLKSYREAYPENEVDVLDLWAENLPEFDGDKAKAKITIIEGKALEGRQATAWNEITGIIDRFSSADHYLFTVPMWNGSIPYRLKLLIDIITQPGSLFGFDPTDGYSGLLEDKKAAVVYTSAVYGDGVNPNFGADFQKSYFDWWLNFIGINDIEDVRFAPNMMVGDPQAELEHAKAEVRTLATGQRFAKVLQNG